MDDRELSNIAAKDIIVTLLKTNPELFKGSAVSFDTMKLGDWYRRVYKEIKECHDEQVSKFDPNIKGPAKANTDYEMNV